MAVSDAQKKAAAKWDKENMTTLGCKVNQYESEVMLELFLNSGFEKANKLEDADVIITRNDIVSARFLLGRAIPPKAVRDEVVALQQRVQHVRLDLLHRILSSLQPTLLHAFLVTLFLALWLRERQ